MERSVKEVDAACAGLSTAYKGRMCDDQTSRTYPTPSEAITQIGRMVACCLGLPRLAPLLVAVAMQ
jgi:hypothetical protein